jgi:hypothetical protein
VHLYLSEVTIALQSSDLQLYLSPVIIALQSSALYQIGDACAELDASKIPTRTFRKVAIVIMSSPTRCAAAEMAHQPA